MLSFALFIDVKKTKFKKLKELTEDFFDLKYKKINSQYVNAYNFDKQFMISINRGKMEFEITDYQNEKNVRDIIILIKEFLCKFFKNQNIGITFYGDNLLYDEFKDVNLTYF